jgi:hypothetical protein
MKFSNEENNPPQSPSLISGRGTATVLFLPNFREVRWVIFI